MKRSVIAVFLVFTLIGPSVQLMATDGGAFRRSLQLRIKPDTYLGLLVIKLRKENHHNYRQEINALNRAISRLGGRLRRTFRQKSPHGYERERVAL